MGVLNKEVLEAECSTAKVEHTEFRVRQRFVADPGQASLPAMPGLCSRLREGGSASRVEIACEGIEHACGFDIHALHCTAFILPKTCGQAACRAEV